MFVLKFELIFIIFKTKNIFQQPILDELSTCVFAYLVTSTYVIVEDIPLNL